MPICRPATPGLLVTLIATILLLVVSLTGPYFKTVFFLKAAVSTSGQSGFFTFGVLGYCSSINGGALNCTKAQVGYEFNPNALLGDNISFLQIPTVVTKWITWGLVLHIVALGLAAVAVVFGLLAHVREMAMTCFSSCISGFAAAVALVAFIFDLVLFFTARARINSVKGGSASIGSAIWLTLVAWVLLFFSGCFYSIGRCCISNRPSAQGKNGGGWGADAPAAAASESPYRDRYAEMMRLDAVKAEADRKARQAAPERGLPEFPAFEERKPLSSNYEAAYEEEEVTSPYRDQHAVGASGRVNGPRNPQRQPTHRSTGYSADHSTSYGHTSEAAGYVPGRAGSRTIDEYNNVNNASYPPITPNGTRPVQSNSPAPYGLNDYSNNTSGGANYHSGYQSQYPSQYTQSHNLEATAAGVVSGVAAAHVAQHYDQPSQYSHGRELSPYDGHHQQQSTYYTAEGPLDQDYGLQYQHTPSPAPLEQYSHGHQELPNPHSVSPQHDLSSNQWQSPDTYPSAYPSSNALPPLAPRMASNQSNSIAMSSAMPTGDTYYTAASHPQPPQEVNNNAQQEVRPESSATSYFPYGNQGHPSSPPQYSQGNYQSNLDRDAKR